MKIFVGKVTVYLTFIGIALLLNIASASAFVLQIDANEPPESQNVGNWDEYSTTQTGMVGITPLTITTTRNPQTGAIWNTTFIDDHNMYGGISYFGSLAQPAGTLGDLLNHYISKGDVFTTSITLGGALLNPTIYIGDIDMVDAWGRFPEGGTAFAVSGDGVFADDTVTAINGALQGFPGAFAAVRYDGLFSAEHVFNLDFNFDFDTGVNSENIAIGIAAEGDDSAKPIPEPATMLLFGPALAGLAIGRRKRA